MTTKPLTPTKRRHGPSPLPPEEQRRHPVSCRLTDAELKTLDARRGAVSRGEWLRLAALAAPPRIVPEVNKVAWSDLARTAANLNQLLKALNEGRITVDDNREYYAALLDVRAKLNEVRSDLIGRMLDEGKD